MSRVYVDFNEMLDEFIVLLSRADSKPDEEGNAFFFEEGKQVSVYMDDYNLDNVRDDLIADGTSELNPYFGSDRTGWGSNVKWILKIDSRGIRNVSDEVLGQ